MTDSSDFFVFNFQKTTETEQGWEVRNKEK